MLAGVTVAAEGTASAELSGAAHAADGVPVFRDDPKLAAGRAELADAGVQGGPRFYLVLTSARLLLVHRSWLSRPAQTVLDLPLDQVESMRISPQAHRLPVAPADGRELRLELPKAPKFLPPVYTELPERLASAKSA